MRFLSFGGSAALHAAALGAVLLAGAWGLRSEPPRAAVAPSTPVTFDLRRDDPEPVAFETPRLPESLPIAEAELEFEPEPLVEMPDVGFTHVARRAPRFDQPLSVGDRLPEPAPEVEAELAAVEIHNPPPSYPPAPRRRGQEGHVLVELRILKDGSVADPVVLECAGSPQFADATLKAVVNWRYRPATLGGAAVDSVHRVRFTFKIQS